MSASNQHTPGPWSVATDDHELSLIATVGSVESRAFGRRFNYAHEVNYESHGHPDADARLCAAAPELLEALEVLLTRELSAMPPFEDGIKAQEMWADRLVDARNNARAVIARARGGQS